MASLLAVEHLEDRLVPTAAFQTLPVLPTSNLAVLDHAQAIFALGQQLGRQANTFVRLGDSNSSEYYDADNKGEMPYLNPLGSASYNPFQSGLATLYPELLGTWQTYDRTLNSAGQNSFSFVGPAAVPGFGSTNVLATMGADIAVAHPAIALIMIGTNEIFANDPTGFQARLTQITTSLTSQGILPVLSTIPPYEGDNNAYEPQVAVVNQVIANVAATQNLPLWNYWREAVTLPFEGILQNQYLIHLSISPNGGGSLWPADLQYGQNVRNLEALQILNWFQGSVVHAPLQYVPPLTTWQAIPDSSSVYSVGRDFGFSPTVDVRDTATGALVDRFLAFRSSFGGGVRVATGDVTGDGYADVVCGMASGGGVLNVFSGADGSLLARLKPFGSSYSGGLTVAVGDLNGTGMDEIVVGKASGGSRVAVYEDQGGSFTLESDYQAFPRLGTNGVSVAVANVQGVGPEVVVGARSLSPTVRLFSPGGVLTSLLRPYGSSVGFGVSVAGMDLNGSGFDQLAVAPVTGNQRVRIIDPATQAMLSIFSAGVVVDGNWGLRLGSIRSATGGNDTLLVGNGPGSATSVLAFSKLTGTPIQLAPDPPGRAFGIFVG